MVSLFSHMILTWLILVIPAGYAQSYGQAIEDQQVYDRYMPADTLCASRSYVTNSQSLYQTPHMLRKVHDHPLPVNAEKGVSYWLFALFVLCISIPGIVKLTSHGVIKRLSGAVVSIRHFSLLEKEGFPFHRKTGYLIILLFFLVVSLLIYLSLEYFGSLDNLQPWQQSHPLVTYGLIFLILFLYYPVKRMIMALLSWVFDTHEATEVYFRNLFVMNQFAGLAMMPLVFLFVFHPDVHLLYGAWILLACINVLKILRGAALGWKASGFSRYYLFLYLCAIELAPLLIAGKTASLYLM